MSDHPSFSKRATDRLRAVPDAPVPAPTPEARDRAIAALGAAIAEQARTRKRRKVVGIAAVAVAAGVASIATAKLLTRPTAATHVEAMRIVGHPTGAVDVVRAGQKTPMEIGATLLPGDRVETAAAAHASVVLSTGTQIEVDSASVLAIDEVAANQVFVASAGASKFSVAKLGAGQRFLVRTSDAEVEVRGTIFRVGVAKSACAGTFTRVDVTEGVVVVRSQGGEATLHAHESWPSGCSETVAIAPAKIESAPQQKPQSSMLTMKAKVPVVAPPTPASELAAQNDMFADGVAKKRAGDHAGAVQVFERFLARWPGSALAESAAVERMRLSSGAAQSAAAKDYLARFPNGSARSEAESLAH